MTFQLLDIQIRGDVSERQLTQRERRIPSAIESANSERQLTCFMIRFDSSIKMNADLLDKEISPLESSFATALLSATSVKSLESSSSLTDYKY